MPAHHPYLGKRLREYRDRARMTVRQLADASGVAFSTISAYENGSRNASIQNIKKLAQALGTTPGILLSFEPPHSYMEEEDEDEFRSLSAGVHPE